MFIAGLFMSAKTWKHPKCPSVGEWINKLWNIQTKECYSGLKRSELKKKKKERNELSGEENTQEKPKCILLSERNQSEKSTSV